MNQEDRNLLLQLKADYESLKIQYAALMEENKLLKLEIIALKDKLNISSNNSSLPPSSDFKKHNKFSKYKKSSDKKRGGQFGRQGSNRPLIDTSEVDKVVIQFPLEECECGGKVEVDLSIPHRHQVIEIPKIKPDITEYQMHTGFCTACGKKYRASLPSGVGQNILGPNAMAVVASNTSYYNMSRSKSRNLLSKYFGIDISMGCLSETEGRAARSLQGAYDNLKVEIKTQKELNVDETMYKEGNIRGYSWIFTNAKITFLALRASRGSKVLKDILGDDYYGLITSDRYAAYNMFKLKNRQICLAHLLRDFRRLSNSEDKKISQIGTILLDCLERIFTLHKQCKLKAITALEFSRALIEEQRKMLMVLVLGKHATNQLRLNRFCRNILKLWQALWNFSKSIGTIDPTNNLAERDIRSLVIWRKISYGSQSHRGTQFIERMLSIRVTCAKRNIDFHNFLVDAIKESLLGNPKILPAL